MITPRPRPGLCAAVAGGVRAGSSSPRWSETNTAPLGTAFTVPVDHRTAKDGHNGPGTRDHDPRSGPTRALSPAILSGRGIFFRWWPRRAAYCAAPAIRRRRSISPGWRAFPPRACCARSSTLMAIAPDRESLFALARPASLGNHLDRRVDSLPAAGARSWSSG